MLDINTLEATIKDYVPDSLLLDVLEYLKLRLNQSDVDLNEFRVIGKGESSINFDLGKIVLRLARTGYMDAKGNFVGLKEHVSHSFHILQPISERFFIADNSYDRVSVLELPKLRLDGITDMDVMKTYVGLRNDGYLWFDIKKNNLGKDAFGNVYLLDYGELHYLGEMNQYNRIHYLKLHSEMCPKYDAIYHQNKTFRNENQKSSISSFKDSLIGNFRKK